MKGPLKNYRLGFDPWALALFSALMAPNLFWAAFPAPADVLRKPSATPALDALASACQMLAIAALILLRRKEGLPTLSRWAGAALGFLLLYYLGWALYYQGQAGPWAILLLTLPPCLSLLSFCLARKNLPALVPLAVFTACHLVYGAVNFL